MSDRVHALESNTYLESWLTVMPPATPAKPTLPPPPPGPKRDTLRELVETVVFVVVLVLMLKLFVLEAFVIPTGSMAETLYGYQKIVKCEQCGYEFPVNATDEADPQGGRPRQDITGYCCPNCRFAGSLESGKPGWTSGDRVLVNKFGTPKRGDVVVFKYPVAPQTGQVAQNYIKRLVGEGGETLAIFRGDLYVTTKLTYPDHPRPKDGHDEDLWRAGFYSGDSSPNWDGTDFRYPNDAAADALFKESMARGFSGTAADGFVIVRKPNDMVLSMRRIVYDNDHQPKDGPPLGIDPRWAVNGSGWAAVDKKGAKEFAHTGAELGRVRYQHLLPVTAGNPNTPGWTAKAKSQSEPGPITMFLAFNSGFQSKTGYEHLQEGPNGPRNDSRWVGDLMLECQATIASPTNLVVLELSKGHSRYLAEFSEGQVRLLRTDPGGKQLAVRPTPLSKAGTYKLRFANVDCRLRVWVDDTAIDFGDEADYPPDPLPEKFEQKDLLKEGWTDRNDVQEPASIAASGEVKLAKLALYRDSYYTNLGGGNLDTYYVQPGHYLCMGDNSAQSSDSRYWGLVPERLMLGRAVFTFFPFPRIGFIR